MSSKLGTFYSVDGAETLELPRFDVGEVVYIGRGLSCQIKLQGTDISSVHCKISRAKNASLEGIAIVDCSLNGTTLNGVRMVSQEPYGLRTSDMVRFGSGSEYIFKVHSHNIFDHYLFGEQDLLGSGNFGAVYKSRHRASGQVVAVKVIQGSADEAVKKEFETLKACEHENVIQIVEQFDRQKGFTCLVMEYVAGGDLYGKVVKSELRKLPELETKQYMYQVLKGVEYLHSQRIIHRDIKLENILLKQATDGRVVIKIADFGLAKVLGEQLFTRTICGTPQYVAPEVLTNAQAYTELVDLWLCGVVVFTCLYGYFPFNKDDVVRDTIGYNNKHDLRSVSSNATKLYEQLLQVQPRQRLNAEDALGHVWFDNDSMEVDQTVSRYSIGGSFRNGLAKEFGNSSRGLFSGYSDSIKLEEEY